MRYLWWLTVRDGDGDKSQPLIVIRYSLSIPSFFFSLQQSIWWFVCCGSWWTRGIGSCSQDIRQVAMEPTLPGLLSRPTLVVIVEQIDVLTFWHFFFRITINNTFFVFQPAIAYAQEAYVGTTLANTLKAYRSDVMRWGNENFKSVYAPNVSCRCRYLRHNGCLLVSDDKFIGRYTARRRHHSTASTR